MKVVLQRCSEAHVVVNQLTVGEIQIGLVALIGITHADTETLAHQMADKVARLRIFADDDGKMNRSVLDVGGDVLSISQFTLLADCRRGRRPAFTDAAPPDQARELYEVFNTSLRSFGLSVPTGIFAADMQVHLVNQGPVTIVLELD